MGSLAAAIARSQPDEGAVRRALAAAPRRGTDVRLACSGRVVVGIAAGPKPAAHLAAEGAWVAAVVGAVDHPHGPDPAAVVLDAFRRRGPAAPAGLRGAWAAVVTDGNVLWCARDHVGFEPLFWAEAPGGTRLVASEPKQVLAGTGRAPEPDPEGVRQIVTGVVEAHRTAFAGVFRSPACTVVTLSPGHPPAAHRYWDPRDLVESARLGVDEAVDALGPLLEQAVARCVTGADALLLSGGIDSPTIAALAAPLHVARGGRPLVALSATFPHLPAVDERPLVERVAEACGLDLRLYEPQAGALDDLEAHVRDLDGPWDLLSMPEVAEALRRAREAGATTLLSGELAEYAHGSRLHLLAHLVLAGRWPAALAEYRRMRAGRVGRRRILADLALGMAPAPLAAWWARARRLDKRRVPAWVGAEVLGTAAYRPDLEPPARHRWREQQVAPFGGAASVAMEAEAMCAARAGVQLRYPLADIDLWELFLSLRAEVKFPPGPSKALVRRAMAGRLPPEILERRTKTLFDDHVRDIVDRDTLRRYTVDAPRRLPGVDYAALADRLAAGDLDMAELTWACDIARANAFLSRW
jgi:asparagine synthase (glutamine-hydrolysing)